MNTQRETDIIKLVIEGKTNREISDFLGISVHTVKAHLEHIYYNYNVHSRIELIIKLSENNILFDCFAK